MDKALPARQVSAKGHHAFRKGRGGVHALLPATTRKDVRASPYQSMAQGARSPLVAIGPGQSKEVAPARGESASVKVSGSPFSLRPLPLSLARKQLVVSLGESHFCLSEIPRTKGKDFISLADVMRDSIKGQKHFSSKDGKRAVMGWRGGRVPLL